MHAATGFASARVVNWVNLCVCCFVILVSHISMRYILYNLDDMRDMTISAKNNTISSRLFLEFNQLSLPWPAFDCILSYRGWHGRGEVAMKLERFFATPLLRLSNSSSSFSNESLTSSPGQDDADIITLSDVYEHVLLRADSAVSSYFPASSRHTARRGTVSSSNVQNVLHLCSSSSCVGPHLLSLFDKYVALHQQDGKDAKELDLSKTDTITHTQACDTSNEKCMRLRLYTLVYGEEKYATLIRDDLRARGVSVVLSGVAPVPSGYVDNLATARRIDIASCAHEEGAEFGEGELTPRHQSDDDGRPSGALYGADGSDRTARSAALDGATRTHTASPTLRKRCICSHCDACGCRYSRGFVSARNEHQCVLFVEDEVTGEGEASECGTVLPTVSSSASSQQTSRSNHYTTSPEEVIDIKDVDEKAVKTMHRSGMVIERYDAVAQHGAGEVACTVPSNAGWYKTEVKAFSEVVFSDSTLLSDLTTHLTHVDSDCEHALATLTFLMGLTTPQYRQRVFSTHILLPLCLNEWTGSTLRMMRTLHDEQNYTILLIFGEECRPHVMNSMASVVAHDIDRMMYVWDTSFATGAFIDLGDHRSEPICTFLLSQKYRSYAELIAEIKPTPHHKSRLKRFYRIISDEDIVLESKSTNAIVAGVHALWLSLIDRITIVLLLIPVCISAVLLLGATKSCRR